jgi:hypothetical protein
MRAAFTLFAGFWAAVGTLCGGQCDAADSVVLGRDRLVFAEKFFLMPPEWRYIAIRWRTERHAHAGRPFRPATEVAAPKVMGTLSYADVHLGDVYDILMERNVGFFVDKVETAGDFEAVLFRLYNVAAEDRFSPGQLQTIFKSIDAAPPGLGLKVVDREFERDLIAKGVVRRSGVWLVDMVLKQGALLVELKCAMDSTNRFAYHRRVLVDGPWPPISGPGRFPDPNEEAVQRAFDNAERFLRRAIDESRARRPR